MLPLNQVSLPCNLEYSLPKNDPVFTLVELCNQLDYTKLYRSYIRHWRKYSPTILFKIIVYGYMRRIYSSRQLEEACNRDICFMWLLQDEPAPDHSTIARFQDERLAYAMEDLFYQLIIKLHELGEVKFANMFVDGTKIEANANRYTFVWAKAVKKNMDKLTTKTEMLFSSLCDIYAVDCDTPEELYENLILRASELNIEFVYGRGKRKNQLQRDIENLGELLERKYKYIDYLDKLGHRNSFSKTDVDATFMRMKDDHMMNGQLKPGYNAQIGVESEYIIGVGLFPNPTDVQTLIPFLNRVQTGIKRKIANVIADAGYESEENYTYLAENNQGCYIKPQNYEISKKRKYKNNKFRVEHMEYDKDNDYYTCAYGKRLDYRYDIKSKSANGYTIIKKVYANESCEGCPYQGQCHKSKRGYRSIKISQIFMEQRKRSRENIMSDIGIILRKNRSIQVEGAFGVIKEDYGFRRFLMRGRMKTELQFFLITFAYDIKKYFNRKNTDRLNKDLF